MELLLIPFGLIFLAVLLGGFGTRRQDCAINTTAEPQRGPDFSGVAGDCYYGDYELNGPPAKEQPKKEMYTYSRENAAEEFADMSKHEGAIDAECWDTPQ